MSYTPTQGLFVNGRVADANELLNELGAIAGAITETDNSIESKAVTVVAETKQYTDDEISKINIDGGTF